MTTVLDVTANEYRVRQDADGRLYADRHGQPWRSLTGDGLVCALAHEIERLRDVEQTANEATAYIKALWRNNLLPSPMSEELFKRLTRT